MVSERGNNNVLGFASQVLRGRWFMAYASFLIMSSSGATYIFGIYSNDIKSALGYDQQTLNTLSFFKDLGGNVSIVAGLINEFTPPWVVLTVGAAMNLSGFLMIYLAITGRLLRPAVWQMCLFIFVGANSQTFSNTGAIVTCVKNFPGSRGTVLGLLKGFLGLSGAIFTQLYLAIYGGNDSKSLVLLIAWLPAVVSLLLIPSIRIVNKSKENNSKPFYCFLYICLALVFYIMTMIIIQRRITFSRAAYVASGAIVIFLLFLPIGVVVKEELRLWRETKVATSNATVSLTVENPVVATPDTGEEQSQSRVSRIFKAPKRGEDYSIIQAVVSVDMALIILSVVSGVGGTLTAIDNMGQIGESLGYPAKSIGTFVSLISIWNCLGRLAAGFVSEIVLVKYKFPRPLVFAIVLLLPCLGHLLIAFGVPGSLYFSSVVIGFCFGAAAPLILAIISDIFGLKYYSTLYNMGNILSPLAVYVLNVKVTGHLYDREAAKQNHGVRASTCIGTECFKLAFLIITASALLSTALSLILVWRTWAFYESDIYAKMKKEDEGEGEVELVKDKTTTQCDEIH